MSCTIRFGLSLILAFSAFLLIGCGNSSENFTSVGQSSPAAKVAREGQAAAGPAGNPPNAEPKAPVQERKIIYTATLDVVVKDLDGTVLAMDKLLIEQKAYIARSEIRNDAGSKRLATFMLRVPADNFRFLLDALAGLGSTERNATDSQDVTEEFVDLQARIKNQKQEEETLNRLMKEKAGDVADVLKIREQIRPVRENIDRAEARLKYLSTLTALSTINLTFREIKNYVPPTTPNFSDKVGRTFDQSWEGFVYFLTSLSLIVVALIPWLPLLLPLGVVGFFVARKLWRLSKVPIAARPARSSKSESRRICNQQWCSFRPTSPNSNEKSRSSRKHENTK